MRKRKFKLNPKVKAKWVRALRSGKYRQGKHQLKYGKSYCCLGVACALKLAKPNSGLGINQAQLADYAFIPKRVQQGLATKNDGGWSFERIANWIEKHL